MGTLQGKLDAQLGALVMRVRGRLTPIARVLLGAMTTLDVHQRDVVATLARPPSLSSTADFGWTAHLRYYWMPPQAASEVSSSQRYHNSSVFTGARALPFTFSVFWAPGAS